MADNKDHYFFYVDITAATRAAVDWARVNNIDPTRINTFNESNGLNGTTDAVINDGDYTGVTCGKTWISAIGGSGMIGIALCHQLSGAKCDRFEISFDTQWMGPRSDAAERSLACHEIGHSIGLLHAGSGCMVDPVSTTTGLTTHDLSHLNSTNYP